MVVAPLLFIFCGFLRFDEGFFAFSGEGFVDEFLFGAVDTLIVTVLNQTNHLLYSISPNPYILAVYSLKTALSSIDILPVCLIPPPCLAKNLLANLL